MDARTPVIVGVGQVTNKTDRLVEPLDLMEQAARQAIADAGGTIASHIGSVDVVNILSHRYTTAAGSLASRLELPPGARRYTSIGGNTPQYLVAQACDAITAGTVDAVLIVGAEAGGSGRRARKLGIDLEATGVEGLAPDSPLGTERNGVGPAEMAAGLFAPVMVYPLFESALAARAGRSPGEQRAWLGRMMAPFTEVAATHPDLAWFPTARTPEELSTVTADNRLVGEPYTKLLNSIIEVDQGAAILVASAKAAEDAGVARDRWVFPWASADCNDVFLPAERPDISRSPAIAAAGTAVFGAAGVGADDLATIDLYSCFPCAVEMSAEALGLDCLDPRGLTVTGGLPYFGGPGNNYVGHSIATTVDLCRRSPADIGLVTGLGWYVTKHAVGLYSATPPPNGWQHPDMTAEQARIDATAIEVVGDVSGVAEVEGFTVLHDRVQGPTAAPIFARFADGRRVVASAASPELAASLSGTSLVGQKVTVTAASGGAPTYEVA